MHGRATLLMSSARVALRSLLLGRLAALAGALCANFSYVVQLGMPKTGTSSTYFYFNQLGYTPCDDDGRFAGKTNLFELMSLALQQGKPVLSLAVQNCTNFGEIVSVYGNRNIVPQLDHLPALKAYMTPLKTLFVLNVRSERSWLRSVDKWSNLRQRLVAKDLEGKPAGIGRRAEDLLAWYRGVSSYVQWSFRHRRDFIVVNVSDPMSLEALFDKCNDSRRYFPMVDPRRHTVDSRAQSSKGRGTSGGRSARSAAGGRGAVRGRGTVGRGTARVTSSRRADKPPPSSSRSRTGNSARTRCAGQHQQGGSG